MASVDIVNAKKAFGQNEILHGVSIDIADGEFVVLVGPSGCGKTTLLRMIAGLETITSGDIKIGERIVNDLPPKDRDIAMVFQNYALYPHMTVADNMAFSLKLRGVSRSQIDERVNKAAGILGLTDYLARFPRHLSGGQRQRVAMGRAIVRDPQVFLFDEPLSNLDAKLRVAMRTEIKDLHQRLGTTTIYVTHDQIEAMTMADRIVVMRDGNVEQIGAPLELYDTPANLFVAGFIGSPAMNLFKGTIESAGRQGFVIADGAFVSLQPSVVAVGPRGPSARVRNQARASAPHQRHRPRFRRHRQDRRADRIGNPGDGDRQRHRHHRPVPRPADREAGRQAAPGAEPLPSVRRRQRREAHLGWHLTTKRRHTSGSVPDPLHRALRRS